MQAQDDLNLYNLCMFEGTFSFDVAHLLFDLVHCFCFFLCVDVLRPSQPSGVMSSAVSLPNHTFTGQA